MMSGGKGGEGGEGRQRRGGGGRQPLQMRTGMVAVMAWEQLFTTRTLPAIQTTARQRRPLARGDCVASVLAVR